MESSTISSAIKNRHQIAFLYRRREILTVEPYCFGRRSDGRLLLRGWQLTDNVGWKLFEVDEMLGTRDTGAPFEMYREECVDDQFETVYARA